MWSVLSLGAMLGSFAAGSVSDYFGRKMAILGGALPFTAGAVLMALWVNLTGLIIGRFSKLSIFFGCSFGFFFKF